MIRAFVGAVQYLTFVPGPPHLKGDRSGARALWFFPAIGAAVALAQMAGIDFVRKMGIGALELPALAALLVALVLTRGIHVAGAARAIERTVFRTSGRLKPSPWDREPPGYIGSISIVCLVLVKFQLYLTAVDYNVAAWPVVVCALGRWAMVLAVWPGRALPHRPNDDFLFHARLSEVLLAGALPVFLAFHYYHRGGWVLTLTALFAATLTWAFYRIREGGVSGDGLHLANELAESLLLFVLLFETMFMGH